MKPILVIFWIIFVLVIGSGIYGLVEGFTGNYTETEKDTIGIMVIAGCLLVFLATNELRKHERGSE